MTDTTDSRIARLEAENRAYVGRASADASEIAMLRGKIERLRDALAPFANAADAVYRKREAAPFVIPLEAWEEARAAMSIIGGGRLKKRSASIALAGKLVRALR